MVKLIVVDDDFLLFKDPQSMSIIAERQFQKIG